ncbi:MAG: hypothetical protein MZU97_04160 [Bacillus subtilis]|nr:hypothetical protein [Bacillus subtilis]
MIAGIIPSTMRSALNFPILAKKDSTSESASMNRFHCKPLLDCLEKQPYGWNPIMPNGFAAAFAPHSLILDHIPASIAYENPIYTPQTLKNNVDYEQLAASFQASKTESATKPNEKSFTQQNE